MCDKSVIRLRPYHPFAVIRQLATGRTEEDFNGIPEVTRRIIENPEIEIEIVRQFDDACKLCNRREPDPAGCVWSEDYSCPSARDIPGVRGLEARNDRILRELGIWVGTRMKAVELLALCKERPLHYADNKPWHKQYEDGFKVLEKMTESLRRR